MILKLKRIDPFKTSAIVAIILFILSVVIFVPLFLIINAFTPQEDSNMLGFGFVIVFIPILYSVFGFIANLIFISIFNYFATRFGGIEIEFDEDKAQILGKPLVVAEQPKEI
ncbi:MAG: hypothetical protein J0L62_14760 [Bacteroidetes bacterium]|nr:hypothetical protein [Bacteroidota bacterium]